MRAKVRAVQPCQTAAIAVFRRLKRVFRVQDRRFMVLGPLSLDQPCRVRFEVVPEVEAATDSPFRSPVKAGFSSDFFRNGESLGGINIIPVPAIVPRTEAERNVLHI